MRRKREEKEKVLNQKERRKERDLDEQMRRQSDRWYSDTEFKTLSLSN